MRSKQRTQSEKDWHQSVADFATESDWLVRKFGGHCVRVREFQLDHIIGAQAKRKINFVSTKVGEWVVIPVPIDLHDLTSNNSLAIHKGRRNFEKQFGNCINLWLDMVENMRAMGYEIPFGKEVMNAI